MRSDCGDAPLGLLIVTSQRVPAYRVVSTSSRIRVTWRLPAIRNSYNYRIVEPPPNLLVLSEVGRKWEGNGGNGRKGGQNAHTCSVAECDLKPAEAKGLGIKLLEIICAGRATVSRLYNLTVKRLMA